MTNEDRERKLRDDGRYVDNERYPQQAVDELIRKSGYPFEIQVFRAAQEHGYKCLHGFRMHTDYSETAEIDVLATKQSRALAEGAHAITAVMALIEAKTLPAPQEFIGFRAASWLPREKQLARFRVHGIPSWNTIREGGRVPPWVDKVISAVDPICQQEWCGQWAVLTQQNNNASAKVEQHSPIASSLTALVKAWRFHARDFSERVLERTASKSPPHLRISIPCLVVGSPHLYLFDADKGTSEAVEWLTLHYAMSIEDEVFFATFDVVCWSGFETYLKAVAEVAENFRAEIEQSFGDVEMQAASERLQAQEEEDDRPWSAP